MSIAQTTSGSPLATPVVWRFVWKELRRMQGFAVGVGVLTLCLMFFFRYGMGAQKITDGFYAGFLILVAFGGAAFVAIGAAITAFAVEREEQTDTFLYTLPRFWWSTFLGKLVATLLLAFGFAAVMSLVAWAVGGGRWPEATAGWNAVKLGAVLIVEATAWGFLISLLVPRPLLAAVLACAATSFSSQLAIAISGGRGFEGSEYLAAIPYRLLICGLVLVLSTLLARRWMTGTVNRRRGKRRRETVTSDVTLRAANPALVQQSLLPLKPTTTRAMLVRLFWQTWRESWRAMLAVVGVGLLLMVSVELLVRTTGESMNFELPLTVFFIPGLCGALAFRCDQRREQYRFLAEHAARPRLVWVVRVAVWGLFLLLLLAPLGLAAIALAHQFVWPHLGSLNAGEWNTATIAEMRVSMSDFFYLGIFNFTLAALAAFAIGQLASLLLKSEILAAGVALFASMVLLFCSYLIMAWRLPPAWCLLPVAIGCLAASYVRLPDRLVDRHSPRRWAGVVLAVVVPIALVVLSIPLIRQAQIDHALAHATSSPMSHVAALTEEVRRYEERTQGADQVTAEYQAVLNSIWDQEFPEHDGRAFEFRASNHFVGASARLDPSIHAETYPNEVARLAELTTAPATAVDNGSTWVSQVAALLVGDFQAAMEQGDLDRALDRYLALQRLTAQVLHNPTGGVPAPLMLQNVGLGAIPDSDLLVKWATAPGQTVERINQAIDDLQAIEEQYPPLDQFVVANYLRATNVLAGRDTLGGANHPIPMQMALFLDSFPGEHERAEKALELFATMSLHYVDRVGKMTGQPLRDQVRFANYPQHDTVWTNGPTILSDSVPYETQRQRWWQTAQSSLLAQEIWNSFWGVNAQLRDQLVLRTELQLERLRLALIAYHWQQGEYPATIGDLLPQVPHDTPAEDWKLTFDPFAGEQFSYSPTGFRHPVLTSSDQYYQSNVGILANVPLIWSVGPNNAAPRTQRVMKHSETGAVLDETDPANWWKVTYLPTEGWSGSAIALPLPTSAAYPAQ